MKLDDYWWSAFRCCFDTEEDVIEFIYERLDTSDFQDSSTDMGGCGEPNEVFITTAQEKREILYDFLMYLLEKKGE